jgi:hypothetical protein
MVMLMLCFTRVTRRLLCIFSYIEKLRQAIRDMYMGFLSVDEFVDQKIRSSWRSMSLGLRRRKATKSGSERFRCLRYRRIY